MAATAKRHSKTVGYIRVSTVDQNTERQLDGLELDKVFTDKASGKDVKRPQLKAALDYVREGDTLVVHSIDRLARNLVDLKNIVSDLSARGVTVQFIKQNNLTFTGEDNPMNNMMLSMLGAVAEFERALINERQREGIAIAKKKGVYKGRKHALTPDRVKDLKARVAAGAKKAAVAREFSISRETLYKYLTA
ncbi:MAG TPA: recombinase family protein [Terracidiphilus sp.]|nr:recombinase family protein [Terracidiphilus sp.]